MAKVLIFGATRIPSLEARKGRGHAESSGGRMRMRSPLSNFLLGALVWIGWMSFIALLVTESWR